jgi:hypothetical protein
LIPEQRDTEWNEDIYISYITVLDASAQYDNLIAVTVDNEVVNEGTARLVKALAVFHY